MKWVATSKFAKVPPPLPRLVFRNFAFVDFTYCSALTLVLFLIASLIKNRKIAANKYTTSNVLVPFPHFHFQRNPIPHHQKCRSRKLKHDSMNRSLRKQILISRREGEHIINQCRRSDEK